ncbi:MAG: cobalamin-binding protein, partial [Planctomycetes bacterium]|nr:cobalamin-binding protein [Planctomycetota bacterium]
GGTFIHAMLEAAGLANAFADQARYPEATLATLAELNLDALLLSSEPFPFAETHAAALRAELPGVQVLLVDGEPFSWYGSRLLAAPTYFASLRARLAP